MDLERAVEFIVSQQAKFAAGLDEIRQKHAELESLVTRIATLQLDLVQHADGFQQQISAAVLALAEEQKRQKEAQRHADERMGVLIGVVDGLVRGQLKQ